jgi:hypothetical protein
MENKEKQPTITVFDDGSAFYKNPPYMVRAALTILTGWPQKPAPEAKQEALKTIREWEKSFLELRKRKLWGGDKD